WWRTELPNDGPRLSANPHQSRDIAEAQQDVAVREFRKPVRMSPFRTIVAWTGNRIGFWLHMFPGAPFPYVLSVLSSLHQIVAIDFVALLFGASQATLHTFGDIRRNLLRAQQHQVAIAQEAAIVVMIPLLDLP